VTDSRYRIDVKDRLTYWNMERDNLDDDEVEFIYEMCRQYFWDDARVVARNMGYDDVYSEGRSGGWLVPEPQPHCGTMDAFFDLEHEIDSLMKHWQAEFIKKVNSCNEFANNYEVTD
jgi:hypothetical protein